MKKLKVGDSVKVILGKDKGKTGIIQTIFHKKETIVVKGINKKVKHVKPVSRDKSGKIERFDAPIHCSNVMLCDENENITRVGFVVENNKKVRVAKKTQKALV